jgi:hypothetical protein
MYWSLMPYYFAVLLRIGSLVVLLIPIGPLFQLQYSFLTFRGPQRSASIFVWPSNMFCQFTGIYWSLNEVIMNNIRGLFTVVLK